MALSMFAVPNSDSDSDTAEVALYGSAVPSNTKV